MTTVAIRAVICLVALPLASAAAQRDTIRTAGLRAPATLARDAAGIVHIVAAGEHDLFFAQGWSIARDRLFQLELWRRRATGTMAALIGARGVAMDRASRLFAFRGNMAAELATYHEHGAAIVGAFVEGINAYIGETERHPDLLPPEFAWLDAKPGRWTPAVVVSRHNGLFEGGEDEGQLAAVVAALGAERVERLHQFGPGAPMLRGDTTLDYAALPADRIKAVLTALRAPFAFEARDLPAARRTDARGADALDRRLAALRTPDDDGAPMPEGSNNWVVRGTKTASGKPLLANDPHRAISIPSLRYYVHLTAPGWNVIGAGEPSLPGVAIGHNTVGAWGLTIFALDGEDVLEYETDPADRGRYRYRDGWLRLRVRRDTIVVRGARSEIVDLKFTRHGPVVYEDTLRHRVWAYRTTMLEPGTAPYLASLRMDQARSWDEFRAACSHAYAPSENMVWADTGGTIGWQVVGKAPIRRNYSGLVPVAGDGRYEWDGFLPVLELPHDVNPERGFINTSNENNVPAGYAHVNAVGREWADRWRADRVAEVLRAKRGLTIADMTALQYDAASLPARRLVPLLRAARLTDAVALAARDTLLAWDGRLLPASIGAGIYVTWERMLRMRTGEQLVPPAMRAAATPLELAVVVDWLTAPGNRADGTPVTVRDSVVALAFGDAIAALTKRLGGDIGQWQYGQPGYKRAAIRHPLSRAVDSATRVALDAAPLATGGDANTVWSTGGRDTQESGASFRIVVDLGNLDASVGTNTPGQSGDPRRAHYRDLFAPWVHGTYFPLPFSAAAVTAATREQTTLLPVR